MTDAVEPVPERLHTVTPRLVLDDAAAALRFYVDAFGAEILEEPFLGPDGKVVHAEIRIGDSSVTNTTEFGHQWMLSTHIEDVDREELDRRMQAWSEHAG